jgi:chromosome segregation ATPase
MSIDIQITVIGSFIVLLLGIIGWFLGKFYDQQKEAHISNQTQFKELLDKLDTLTSTLQEHRTDVEVIKEKINTLDKSIYSLKDLSDRINKIERDIFGINSRK